MLTVALLAFATPSQSPAPLWSHASLGDRIGVTDFVAVEVQGRMELIVGGSRSSSSNDYWHVLRYESAMGGWQNRHLSPLYEHDVLRLAAGPLRSLGEVTLAVLRDDGVVELHDARTRIFHGSFPTAVVSPRTLALGDLDGDGLAEVVVLGSQAVAVHAADGTLLATAPGSGYDAIVAQLDGDPAMELAVASGQIYEGIALAHQWTLPITDGRRLEAGDLDGDGDADLIVQPYDAPTVAVDVAQQSILWTVVRNTQDALRLTDLDLDGRPEVLIADAQHGDVACYTGRTGSLLWEIPYPESGVSDLIVFDADGDGDLEIVFGVGHGSSGPDFLCVADWQTQSIVWQSPGDVAPYLGPGFGQVDGDPGQEIVLVAPATGGGNDGGRILVFDASTGLLEAASAPLGTGGASFYPRSMCLNDLDNDGSLEVILAGDTAGNGRIEVHDVIGTAFTKSWSRPDPPLGNITFHSVTAGDPDRDGQPEIVAGAGRFGAAYTQVYVYDWLTGTEEWRSLHMSGGLDRVGSVTLGDSDGDGDEEILARVEEGDAYVFDGASKLLEAVAFGPFTSLVSAHAGGSAYLLLGGHDGGLSIRRWNGLQYAQVLRRSIAGGPLRALVQGPPGTLWVDANGRVSLLDVAAGVLRWQSGDRGALTSAATLTPLPTDPRFVFAAGTTGAMLYRAR
jgi:hypothetical protein